LVTVLLIKSSNIHSSALYFCLTITGWFFSSDPCLHLSNMGLSENQPRQRGGFGRLSYSGTRPWPEVPVGNHEHDSAAVVIIGGGIAGMNMAIDLLTNRKVKSFIIIEKGGGFGGTWRDNKFPGCCCDVWSHLYCYSFEQNPDWSRAYPGQEEILVRSLTPESAIYNS
jgi:hypothetical protein